MNVSSNISENSELTIGIEGVFNFTILEDFRKTYEGIDISSCIIDLRSTEHIDSSGLELLLGMRRTLGKTISIKIINCRPTVRKIFQITHFETLFDIE